MHPLSTKIKVLYAYPQSVQLLWLLGVELSLLWASLRSPGSKRREGAISLTSDTISNKTELEGAGS